jgi:uncharacterized protein
LSDATGMSTPSGSSPLVDVHVHLYPDKDAGQQAKERYVIWEYGDDPEVQFSDVPGDLLDLADIYGNGGFDRAIVVHLFDTDLARQEAVARFNPVTAADPQAVWSVVEEAVGEAMRNSNQWIAGVAASDPLVEVLVTVDPTLLTPEALSAHVAALADAGVRGIKLHPVSQGYLPDDERLHPIYQTCADAGLVVLSHSGPGHHGDASARPSEFGPVAERWPELKLVLAHLGGAAWHETEELAAAFPHVMFDLSEIIEWPGAPNAPTSPEMVNLIRSVGVERVMLGSDFPWYDPVTTVDHVMALPHFSAQEREAVLGGNAMRFFGLDHSTMPAP